jgi:hypothetical protein
LISHLNAWGSKSYKHCKTRLAEQRELGTKVVFFYLWQAIGLQSPQLFPLQEMGVKNTAVQKGDGYYLSKQFFPSLWSPQMLYLFVAVTFQFMNDLKRLINI